MSKLRVLKVIAAVFGSFFLIFGAILAAIYNPRLQEAVQSLEWPEVPGQVLFTKVQVSQGKSVSMVPWVYVTYKVGSTTFSSGENLGRYSSKEEAQRVLDGFPKGKELTVYYNPKDCNKFVLRRGEDIENMRFMLYSGLTLLCTGAVGIASSLIIHFRTKNQ